MHYCNCDSVYELRPRVSAPNDMRVYIFAHRQYMYLMSRVFQTHKHFLTLRSASLNRKICVCWFYAFLSVVAVEQLYKNAFPKAAGGY